MLDISQLADFLSSLPVRQLCGLILLLFKSFHFFNWDDFQKAAEGGYFVSFSFKDCLRLHFTILSSPGNSSPLEEVCRNNLIKYLASLPWSTGVWAGLVSANPCSLQSAAVVRLLNPVCVCRQAVTAASC